MEENKKLTEHNIQSAFIQYCEWMSKQDWRYENITAVPNGGQRHPAVAMKLKKEGVKAGYPDVLIDIPTNTYPGLRIEFKKPKGKQSESQKAWEERLTRAGYLYKVCYSTNEAIKVLTDYLNDKNN